ncbi:MAG: transketolase family protein [Firmicutes bacterium]|nr:transketolase family protein [Bacillota bacterium]
MLSSPRDVLGKVLLDIADEDPNLVVLTADLGRSCRIDAFANRFPDRFFDVGIAEQNLMGIAAGFALYGFIPVACTFAVFTGRAFDQIRQSIAYSNLPVKIVGTHSGLSNAKDGATHQALFDLALFLNLPHFTILNPRDADDARTLLPQTFNRPGPAYFRLSREELPRLGTPPPTLGKGQILRTGKDVTIAATGAMVWRSLAAADQLERYGIAAEVLSYSTLKPFDEELLWESAQKTQGVITVEDHGILGGFGSQIAFSLGRHGLPAPHMMGTWETLGDTGSLEDLYRLNGLSVEHIVRKVESLLNRQRQPGQKH